MSTLAQGQPRRKRQEIPDPQIRNAADQFETARRLLDAQPPGAGVVYPLMNTAAVAIELYLKCLSAEKVHTDTGQGWKKVSAKPQRGHGLTALLDKIDGDLRNELGLAFSTELLASGGISFRAALELCEGTFETSRYPFEPGQDLSKAPLPVLMECSHFLHRFVAKLLTRETIQWLDQEPQHACSQSQ